MAKKSKVKVNVKLITDDDRVVGKRLRLRRIEEKMSQETLGDKLGLTFQQIQKYEKGVNRVPAARLKKMAEILDCPVSFFYDLDEEARATDSLLFVDPTWGLRMLRAWATIEDEEVRRSFVTHMEAVAGVA